MDQFLLLTELNLQHLTTMNQNIIFDRYGVFDGDELSIRGPRVPDEEFQSLAGAMEYAADCIRDGSEEVSISPVKWSEDHGCYVEDSRNGQTITITANGDWSEDEEE